MSILTIRLPEAKRARLRRLADSRGVSMNKLIDELATVALAQHAEVRFRTLAAKGSRARGLHLLDKLDRELRQRRFRPANDAGRISGPPDLSSRKGFSRP